MPVRIVDHSAAVRHAVGVHLAANLGDAAELLRVEIEAAIGVQGPPRSLPGDPPHRDSGDLQNSFTDELDANNLEARVGSDSPYVAYLEIGTGRMAARPHILATLLAQASNIARVICRRLP